VSTFLRTNHLFLRNPRGGVEDIAEMRRAGFRSIFCNIGDHSPSEWDVIRLRAAAEGLECGPWLRTAEGDNQFSRSRFLYLIDVADNWGSPLIVNCESELKGTGSELTSWMAAQLGNRDAAISMEAWPFADVYWEAFKKYPILPQIFPVESNTAKNPEACRAEWFKYGVECVVFTFGAYGTQEPTDYDLFSPYGVYTADDCGQNYRAWSSEGTLDPCAVGPEEPDEGEDLMAKIGSDHGITAFVNWLQQQPGVPVARTPNYDENNPATWPWPERLERTLNMLREDHDERN
jgi:hypothetical protein